MKRKWFYAFAIPCMLALLNGCMAMMALDTKTGICKEKYFIHSLYIPCDPAQPFHFQKEHTCQIVPKIEWNSIPTIEQEQKIIERKPRGETFLRPLYDRAGGLSVWVATHQQDAAPLPKFRVAVLKEEWPRLAFYIYDPQKDELELIHSEIKDQCTKRWYRYPLWIVGSPIALVVDILSVPYWIFVMIQLSQK